MKYFWLLFFLAACGNIKAETVHVHVVSDCPPEFFEKGPPEPEVGQ